jgi:hypothetical protein
MLLILPHKDIQHSLGCELMLIKLILPCSSYWFTKIFNIIISGRTKKDFQDELIFHILVMVFNSYLGGF